MPGPNDPLPPVETLPNLTETIVLVCVAAVIYLVLVGGAQMLRRLRGIQFGWTYHSFACAAALLAGFAASLWAPSWRETALEDLEAATVLLATFPFIVLLNRVLWTRTLHDGHKLEAPRLLADTTGLVVFVTVALMVLDIIFGIRLPYGVLAGSGVLAIVLGLAMQDLLGNIFAGLALYVSKPFKAGDWLLVDNQHARVLEVTWRSTRLLTDDEVVLEVPNNDLVKRPITNFHQPYPRHALRVTIGLHYDVPPARAQMVLQKTTARVPGVCTSPPPQVYLRQFADSSVVYEIKFWIEDHALRSRISSEVLSHCWYAVKRAGMEIPFPHITVLPPAPRDAAAQARAGAEAALRGNAIFSFLPAAQVEELVRHSPVMLFSPAEPLVEQGADGASMFLLVRGRVEVRVTRDGQTEVVTALGAGDCLGEISMLTGEKRSATVVAIDEVEAVEITHAAFSTFIRHHPEVINRLGDLLTQRQLANEQKASTRPPTPAQREQTRSGIVRRLSAFFQLGE